MSEARIWKPMARALAALGAGTAAAELTELGWTRVTLADGSRLAWVKLPEGDDADIAWEWLHAEADGWFIAGGGAEDRDWLLLDLVAHLRAA